MLKALAIVGVTALVAIGGHRHADADSATASAGSTATVMPSEVAPGAHVNVVDGNDCSRKGGVATSAAFAGPVKLGPLAADMVGGTGRIRRGMTPGTYQVTLSCGSKVTTRVTVAAAGTAMPDGTVVAAAGQAAPQLPDNRSVTTGFVVVAGAVAMFGYVFRRRRIFSRPQEEE
jgi:hypothetical protein